MVEGISDTASSFSTHMDFIEFPEVEDKGLYRIDEECVICGAGFGLLKQKKFKCKFCYRGVCGKCSLQRFYNPRLEKTARICNNCF